MPSPFTLTASGMGVSVGVAVSVGVEVMVGVRAGPSVQAPNPRVSKTARAIRKRFMGEVIGGIIPSYEELRRVTNPGEWLK